MREFPGNSYFFVWGPRCMHAIGAFTKRISRVRLHDTTSARQKVFFLHLPASSDQTVFCPSSPFDSNCYRRGKCLRFPSSFYVGNEREYTNFKHIFGCKGEPFVHVPERRSRVGPQTFPPLQSGKGPKRSGKGGNSPVPSAAAFWGPLKVIPEKTGAHSPPK